MTLYANATTQELIDVMKEQITFYMRHRHLVRIANYLTFCLTEDIKPSKTMIKVINKEAYMYRIGASPQISIFGECLGEITERLHERS